MNRTTGRTGARARANIQLPPSAAEVEAPRRNVAQSEDGIAGRAAGHPTVKVWKARPRTAQAALARAPRD